MSRVISIHSYRGGTGKSNTTANVATVLAKRGLRVGVVDTDIASPGIHVLFELDPEDTVNSLNQYLWGECEISQAAYDVTPAMGAPLAGKVFLIPSSSKAGEIARVLREGYDVGLLNDGFQCLIEKLNLDVLMIDTHPGINEETLLSIAISDALAIVLRPDYQDYQGTGVTVEIARKLAVPRILLVVNKVPQALDAAEVKSRVEATYGCPVAGVLPHCDEMMTLASKGIFILHYPDHPVSARIEQIADQLMA